MDDKQYTELTQPGLKLAGYVIILELVFSIITAFVLFFGGYNSAILTGRFGIFFFPLLGFMTLFPFMTIYKMHINANERSYLRTVLNLALLVLLFKSILFLIYNKTDELSIIYNVLEVVWYAILTLLAVLLFKENEKILRRAAWSYLIFNAINLTNFILFNFGFVEFSHESSKIFSNNSSYFLLFFVQLIGIGFLVASRVNMSSYVLKKSKDYSFLTEEVEL